MSEQGTKVQACFFILLLAGCHVGQIDAARKMVALESKLNSMYRSDEKSSVAAGREGTFDWSGGSMLTVPTDDSGCTMKAGACTPTQYCAYKRKWLSWSRDARCHLDTVFRPDNELSQMYAENSGVLVRRAEKFRTAGTIMRLSKMRRNLNVIGLCENAADSNVPPKPKLNNLKESFRQKSIKEYWEQLQGYLPSNSPAFERASFSQESLQANTFERTVDSLDKGMDSTAALRAIKKKLNLAKLMEVKENPSADPETLKAQLQAAFPSMAEDKLTEMMEKSAMYTAKLEGDCNGDASCAQINMVKTRENVIETIAEEEERTHESLLEFATSSGMEMGNHTHESAHAQALIMLEQHIEKVEASGEDTFEALTKGGEGVLLLIICIVCIVILSVTACMTIAGCAVPLLLIAVLSFAFGLPMAIVPV